jgi:membrane-associated phospholipid phosphatase
VRGWIALFVALSLPSRSLCAQTAPAIRYRAGWADVVSVAAGGGLYFLPGILNLPKGGPSCAPCDPQTLPGIDRWAVHDLSNTADIGSTVALLSVAAWTAAAGLGGQPADQWHGNFAMFANAASWTAASTDWLKVLIHRKRPVLYTSGAAAAAQNRDNVQSLPSLHASLSFAAATSYLVMAGREHLPHRTRNSVLLYLGAAAVSALRVDAGKHFPTDVAAGAALGSLVGWLAAAIHPTR